MKIVIDKIKLKQMLEEVNKTKDKRGFIAEEWQEYYFQEPSYNIKYSKLQKR